MLKKKTKVKNVKHQMLQFALLLIQRSPTLPPHHHTHTPHKQLPTAALGSAKEER